MSPAGQQAWGRDQCENDRDHEVDHDERLRITDIAPGRYDVRFKDKTGRVCVVKDIEVKDGAIFSIEEKELSGCTRRSPDAIGFSSQRGVQSSLFCCKCSEKQAWVCQRASATRKFFRSPFRAPETKRPPISSGGRRSR